MCPACPAVVLVNVSEVPTPAPTRSVVLVTAPGYADEVCRTQIWSPGRALPAALVKVAVQPTEYSPPVTETLVPVSRPVRVMGADTTGVLTRTSVWSTNAELIRRRIAGNCREHAAHRANRQHGILGRVVAEAAVVRTHTVWPLLMMPGVRNEPAGTTNGVTVTSRHGDGSRCRDTGNRHGIRGHRGARLDIELGRECNGVRDGIRAVSQVRRVQAVGSQGGHVGRLEDKAAAEYRTIAEHVEIRRTRLKGTREYVLGPPGRTDLRRKETDAGNDRITRGTNADSPGAVRLTLASASGA